MYGGVGIYLSENIITIQILNDIKICKACHCPKCNFESLFLNFQLRAYPFTVGGIYRHPTGNTNYFVFELESTIYQIVGPSTIILNGDTKCIIDSIEKSHRVYRSSIGNSSQENIMKYKMYKTVLRKFPEESYYHQLFDDTKQSTYNLWICLGPVINPTKTRKQLSINKIFHQDKYITDTYDIANIMKTYFNKQTDTKWFYRNKDWIYGYKESRHVPIQ